MMDTVSTVDILNELLVNEQRRLATRLAESNVFVSRPAAENMRLVHRMAEESREHDAWLVASITELGGVPGPRVGDITTADVHYQELRRVLPRLLADHEALIRKYKLAAERLNTEPRAVEVVQRILARHQADLEILTKRSESTPKAAE